MNVKKIYKITMHHHFMENDDYIIEFYITKKMNYKSKVLYI